MSLVLPPHNVLPGLIGRTESPHNPLPSVPHPTALYGTALLFFSAQLATFYLELRALAQDDPEDYAGWEGLEEALDGEDGGAGGAETDTGSGSDAGHAKTRGKKR